MQRENLVFCLLKSHDGKSFKPLLGLLDPSRRKTKMLNDKSWGKHAHSEEA